MNNRLRSRQDIVIQPLDKHFLDAIISIHRLVLGDTLNSRLGAQHLSLLYKAMLQSPACYVGVALYNDRPVGFISGTLDVQALKSLFFQSASLIHWTKIFLRVLAHPNLFLDWWQGMRVSQPVFRQNTAIKPILTTIGVDESLQGIGIGKELVNALEEFFLEHKAPAYRLDTLATNKKARKFYSAMGFLEVEERAGSVILIKTLDTVR